MKKPQTSVAELTHAPVKNSSNLIGAIWQDSLQVRPGEPCETGDFSCVTCGTDQALQMGTNDQLMCLDCIDQTLADDWYDLGVAG